MVIQKQFKARYLKIRLFDRSNNSQFLMDTFKEVWTQEHQTHIAPSQAEGQYFWVNYDKVFSYYASLSINSFRYYNLMRSYNKSLLKLTLDGEHSCILVSFTIERNEDKIILGAHQKHKNFFSLIKENYQYSNLRMILVKV